MSNKLLYGASHPHAYAIAFINVEATRSRYKRTFLS
jgi:hypothetical protein